MKRTAFRFVQMVMLLPAAAVLMGAQSPADREATDPASVSSAANPDAAPIPVDALFYTRSVSGPAWSPDGRELVFTSNVTGRANLWKVGSNGGWPVQLTVSDESQHNSAYSPDGKWIVFNADDAGNEMSDIFSVPAGGGRTLNLTNTPEISESGTAWSPDGTRLLILYKKKSESFDNVAVFDWRTRQSKLITHEWTDDHRWQPAGWSPDGQYAYATRINAAFNDADIYRIEVASGKSINLTEHDGHALNLAGDLSPDGKVMLVTAPRGGARNVALLDIASRELTWVTDTGWEARAGEFSPDGRQFTYTLNVDGRTEAYLVARDTLQARKLAFPEGMVVPVGTPSAFSPDGRRMLVSYSGSQAPGDLWVYDLAKQRATQLTRSALASLEPANIPPSQLVHYRTFDGKMISAFVWMPFNLERDGSHPGVVLPHGGPTGQNRDNFNATVAALTSRGYVCISPNFRGSTGYGAAFENANYQDFGNGDLKDVVHAARFLVDTGYVDAKKIGITGGSYGGYMTLIAIGRTPDVWAAGVSRYGIVNWLSMLEHSDPLLAQYEISKFGDPVEDRQVYIDASPITYLDKAKAPLLVLQGDNDIRVPREEAEQVVATMERNGQTVAAHYYPDEGHGFVKRENAIDALQRTIAWFDKYLKHGEAGVTPGAADPHARAGSRFDRLIVNDRVVGTGAEARAGMALKVHYTAWVYDAAAADGHGRQFDSTAGGKPLSFSLGDPRLIAGWNQGIPGMRVGGKRELRIPPALGYGSTGTKDGVIPPDTALVFEIELVEAGGP